MSAMPRRPAPVLGSQLPLPMPDASTTTSAAFAAEDLELDVWGRRLGAFSATRIGSGLEAESVDLVVTSPPYWRKRDYGVDGQIGQEATPGEYATRNLGVPDASGGGSLRPTGSVFLNIGDTYHKRDHSPASPRGSRLLPPTTAGSSATGSSGRRTAVCRSQRGTGSRIGTSTCIHLVCPARTYYYDLFGYSEVYRQRSANPGDVWQFNPGRHMGEHLAPFPTEIVRARDVPRMPDGGTVASLRRAAATDRPAHGEARRDPPAGEARHGARVRGRPDACAYRGGAGHRHLRRGQGDAQDAERDRAQRRRREGTCC